MYSSLCIIASYYNVSIIDIIGGSRKGSLPEARQLACVLLSKNHTETSVAKYLNLSRAYVNRSVKDMSFYINTYPKLKQKVMHIEKEIEFTEKARQLTQWLQNNHTQEPCIVYEKQKELEQINHQINKHVNSRFNSSK